MLDKRDNQLHHRTVGIPTSSDRLSGARRQRLGDQAMPPNPKLPPASSCEKAAPPRNVNRAASRFICFPRPIGREELNNGGWGHWGRDGVRDDIIGRATFRHARQPWRRRRHGAAEPANPTPIRTRQSDSGIPFCQAATSNSFSSQKPSQPKPKKLNPQKKHNLKPSIIS